MSDRVERFPGALSCPTCEGNSAQVAYIEKLEAELDKIASGKLPPDHPQIRAEKAEAERDEALQGLAEYREGLGSEEAQAAVVDFLDSWRFCPVSKSSATSRSCLEDAANQLLAALQAIPIPDVERGDGEEVSISLDPECIHAENIGEFYPEAIGMATAALEHMLTPGGRDHRDAGILAACTVSEALRALVAVKKESGGAIPIPGEPNTAREERDRLLRAIAKAHPSFDQALPGSAVDTLREAVYSIPDAPAVLAAVSGEGEDRD